MANSSAWSADGGGGPVAEGAGGLEIQDGFRQVIQEVQDYNFADISSRTGSADAAFMNLTGNGSSGAINGSVFSGEGFPPLTARDMVPPDLTVGIKSFFIASYSLIMVLSVVGNLLVIVVVAGRRKMRTVTNTFLVSLAVSDLLIARSVN